LVVSSGCTCDGYACSSGVSVELVGENGAPLELTELILEFNGSERVVCSLKPAINPVEPACKGPKGPAGQVALFSPSDVSSEYSVAFVGGQRPLFLTVLAMRDDTEVARFESGWLNYRVQEATRCHDECRVAGVTFAVPSGS
jgi:hypothetical protein